MVRFRHKCSLHAKGTSGLPRLAPHAKWYRRFARTLKKLMLLNPSNYKCKKLYRNKSAVLAERKRHSTGPHWFIIHPLSTFNLIQEVIFSIVWCFVIIMEPLRILDPDFSDSFEWARRLLVCPLQLILIILFFITGYVDEKNNCIVTEPKRIAVQYLKTFFFFDFVSSNFARMLIGQMVYIAPLDELSDTVKMSLLGFYIGRIICTCARINTLLRSLENFLSTLSVNKRIINCVLYALKTLICIHTCACINYFLPYFVNQVTLKSRTSDSWISQSGLVGQKLGAIYAETFLLSLCYFFGMVTKHDITITVEQICFIVTALFGRLYTLYLVADILSLFGVVGVSESMYERNMAMLHQYMMIQDLPDTLQKRMLKYYQFKFQGRYFKETDIIGTLSEHLRTELFLFSAKKMVSKSKVFMELPRGTLGAIIAAMKSETYSPRDIIVKIAARLEHIYFISTGTVAIMNKNGIELTHLEDGDEFGAGCLIVKEQMYAVMAVETTEVFVIGKDQLVHFLRPHPKIMTEFYNSTKKRLQALKKMEENVTKENVDVMIELEHGNILESRTRRLIEIN